MSLTIECRNTIAGYESDIEMYSLDQIAVNHLSSLQWSFSELVAFRLRRIPIRLHQRCGYLLLIALAFLQRIIALVSRN